MPSGISKLVRQIHPRDRPEIRTCTQSALKSSISNSSCALARNKVLPFRLGVETTGVPDFFMATKFFGCAWFFSTSSKLAASACKLVTDFSSALFCAFFVSASRRLDKPGGMEVEKVRSASADRGIGADMAGSVLPAFATFWSAALVFSVPGKLETGGGEGGGNAKLELLSEFPSGLAACGLARRSVNCSRRSDSSLPFEVST